MKSLGFLAVGFACAAITWGQAAVEYTVGTGAATGAAAGAKGAGQAVGGVFGAVTQTLNKAGQPGAANSSAVAASSTTSVTPPTGMTRSVATKPIDPSQVTVGMERDEVLARFGEPATRTTQIRRSQQIDTFWYATTTKDELIVSLNDGKVVSTVLASQRKRTVASARK
jgi:outer membrane protein assembly factor BamE (lipoprotein component of BamABCDE complex)